MNDLGYGQLSNLNWSLKLELMRVENYRELLLWYFIVPYSLSQSPQVLRADDSILNTQSSPYLIYDVIEISWPGIHKL